MSATHFGRGCPAHHVLDGGWGIPVFAWASGRRRCMLLGAQRGGCTVRLPQRSGAVEHCTCVCGRACNARPAAACAAAASVHDPCPACLTYPHHLHAGADTLLPCCCYPPCVLCPTTCWPPFPLCVAAFGHLALPPSRPSLLSRCSRSRGRCGLRASCNGCHRVGLRLCGVRHSRYRWAG